MKPVTHLSAARCIMTPLCLALLAGLAQPALAHGSMESPISRVYQCFKEGPEAPTSAACQAAVAQSGPQMLYDWAGVNQPTPTATIRPWCPMASCARAARPITAAGFAAPGLGHHGDRAGRQRQVRLCLERHRQARHQAWTLYVTRDGWSETTPLKWSDLQQFCTLGNLTADATTAIT